MDNIESKDQQKQAMIDELFQKFQNELDLVLMDFPNNDKIFIADTFLKMTELAIDPIVLLGDSNNDKEIKAVYTEEIIKNFKKRFGKADQIGLNKYFIHKEILSHITEEQIICLRKHELLTTDTNKNEILSFGIFVGFMRLVEKYLNLTLHQLYFNAEPEKTNKRRKPGTEDKIQKIATWKGSKVDFIKLLYALCIANQIDHKKGVTVITEKIAQAMGVDYSKDSSDLHKSIIEARKNGYDLYSFFDDLKEAFQSYVESDDKAKLLKG